MNLNKLLKPSNLITKSNLTPSKNGNKEVYEKVLEKEEKNLRGNTHTNNINSTRCPDNTRQIKEVKKGDKKSKCWT